MTTSRAATMLFSNSYLDETLGFVVADHAREQFSSWASIRSRPATVIAVPDVPYYIDKLRERLPRAELRVIHDVGPLFAAGAPGVDAVAMRRSADQRDLLYPQFSVVVPETGS